MSDPSDGGEGPPPPLPKRKDFPRQPPPVPPKFSSSDVNLLRYFALFRIQGPAAIVFGCTYTQLTRVGAEGVVKFCQNTLKFSNSRLRNLFSREELEELDGAWDPSEKDITFLYKLLQVVCGLAPPNDAVWWEPSHRLEYLLRSVKSQRNAVAHSIISISDAELDSWSENLLTDLRAILAHVADRTCCDLQQDLQHMETTVKRILCSRMPSVPREELESDRSKTQRTQEESRREFLSKICEELRTRYAGFCSVPQLLWEASGTTPVEQVFVAPDLFSEHEAVPLARLLPPHQEFQRQVTVLQGSSGAGKTTLCRFLVSAWCRDPAQLSYLSDVDVLLLMRCGSVLASNLTTFLAEELLPEVLGDLPRGEILSRLRDLRVMLVADGWDEAGAAGKALLHHALTTLPALRVLVTLRPEFVLDLHLELGADAHANSTLRWLRLHGLGASARKEYLNKALGGTGQEVLLRDLCQAEHLMLEMQRLPMTLALLMQLWREDCEQVRGAVTRQRLFERIMDAKVQRLLQRHLQRRTASSHMIRKGIQLWVQRLDAAAWEALQTGSSNLSEPCATSLRKVCVSEGLDEVSLLSALVGGYEPRSNTWFFEHSLMQQFLAARFLAREREVLSSLVQRKERSEARRLLPTVSFAAAILSAEGRMNQCVAAEVAALLGAPGVPWEVVGDVLLETDLNPHLTAATSRLLADANAVDRFCSSRASAMVAVLRHTGLEVAEDPYVHVDAVPPELVEALALVSSRGGTAVCVLDSDTDLELFSKALTEAPRGPPRFALAPSLQMHLRSTPNALALHACIRAACGSSVTLYLRAADEDEVSHICAFLRLPKALSLCMVSIGIPEDPWSDVGLGACVGPILEACAWTGKLFLNAPPSLLQSLHKEVHDFRRRREDLWDLEVEYLMREVLEGDYENIIFHWIAFPLEEGETLKLGVNDEVNLKIGVRRLEEEREEEEGEVQTVEVTKTKKTRFRALRSFARKLSGRKKS